jgi:site-specific DNA-adenine methylase
LAGNRKGVGVTLKAPFPWFGGKSTIAAEVWRRFGNVRNYVEPFLGSGAVLLARPLPFQGTETVNDIDGMICNFWRAIQDAPEAVAEYSDWPVNECDLHARHAWLVGQKESLQARLEGDPDFYDAKIAGWWCWGMALWIGGGFCSGEGPWQVVEGENGQRQLVHLGDTGRGVKRQRVHLGDAGQGVQRRLVHIGGAEGIKAKRVQSQVGGSDGDGSNGLVPWFIALAERLARVRVCCGDWSRVCGPSPTIKQGLTAVFLDPPYSAEAGRVNDIYTHEDASVAHVVREWCLEWGSHKLMKIALCGYEGEGHEVLEEKGWKVFYWKGQGGYSNKGREKNDNRFRERIWFSPGCLFEKGLFDG